MRSLKVFAAALPLYLLAASAVKNDFDTTIIVTTTRTVTMCPIQGLFTCEPELARPWMDWITTSNTPKPTSNTVSGTSLTTKSSTSSQSGSNTTSGTGASSVTTTRSGTTTTNTGASPGSSTNDGGSSATSSQTTTSFTSITTTSGLSNGTTTTSTTSVAQNATCPTSSPGYHCPETPLGADCNSASDRKQWCHSKSASDDTHNDFFSGDTRYYTLVLTQGFVDADNNGARPVYLINGKTPGEAIEANWGDIVVIEVDNQIGDNITSIHWHGVRQVGTNDQDGVPGVTECGIAPGTTRTYKWHASSYGTGWYHSHALAQYGGGLRGPLIIHGPATSNYDVDMGPVMIDEKLEKGVFDLAAGIARTPAQLPAAHNVLFNGMNTSPDNTKGTAPKWVVQSGKKYLFRIINSSAQSAYALRFDHHNMTVVSADFVAIAPYTTEWLYLSSGQRYNVIIEANQPNGAYYFRAVTQTGCGGRCLNDGKGNANGIIEYADSIGVEPFYGGNLTASFNVQTDCKDEPLDKLRPYVAKSGGSLPDFTSKVQLLPGGSAGSEDFGAAGSAIRWYLGPPQDASKNSNTTRSNKAINVTFEQPTLKTMATVQQLNYSSPIFSNAVSLEGPANQWVYFIIQNNFQTAHPMHLHGHDFSVLGAGKGVFDVNVHGGLLNFANPIRRDTTNLFGMPIPNSGNPPQYVSGWTVIGFETDNPGAWVMHCHILWHADGGMGLQYLERPGEINAEQYYNTDFRQQCANVERYHANGGKQKAPYEAGLKRHLAEHSHYGYHHGHAMRDMPSY